MAGKGVVLLTFRTSGTTTAAKKAREVGTSLDKTSTKAAGGVKKLSRFAGGLDGIVGSALPVRTGLGSLSSGLDGFADNLGKSGSKMAGWKVAAAGVAAGLTLAAGASTAALYKVGKAFDEVEDTIRVGTGASGEALDGLVGSAKNVANRVPADLSQIAPVVADLNTRMGLSGNTLDTVASQYLEAGRLLKQDVDIQSTSAAFTAFKIEGDSVVGAMDSLFQVSQATGVGMNELANGIAQNAPALQQVGFGFEDSISLLGSLDKAGLNSQSILSGMSRGLVTLAKDGEQPQDAFKRVTAEVQGFVDKGDQAAALDLAGKVFGTRGATQFVGALESGVLSMDDLMAATGATGDTILGLAEETASAGESWKIIKNNALTALEPIGTAIFDLTSGAMAGLASKAQELSPIISDGIGKAARWFKRLGDTIWPIISPVLELWTAFSPLSLIFSALEPVLPQLAETFGLLASVIGGTLSRVLPDIVAAAAPVAEMLSGALADAAIMLMPIVTEVAQSLAGALGTALVAVAPLLSMLAEVAGQVLMMVMPLIPPILDLGLAFMPIITSLIPIVGALLPPLIDLLMAVLPVVVELTMPITELAVGAIGLLVGWLETAVNWISIGIGWISDLVTGSGTARDQLLFVWEAVKWGFSKVWEWIDSKVFKPFRDGIDLIVLGFEVGSDAIAVAWEGIKLAAAKPINFVLDTVWNNGIRSFWNDVVGTLGLDDLVLPEAPLVKFAEGGVMPGYTPGRDVHKFYSPTGGLLELSGGEAIMRPEFTRAVGGPSGVDRLNALARQGQSFADGGVWGAIGDFGEGIWETVTSAASIAWSFISDPAGAIQEHIVGGIIRPLLGDGGNIFQKAIGELPIMLLEKIAGLFPSASASAQGSAGMGWEAMWEVVRNADPNLVMTSNYRPGAVTVNGGQSYHALGRAIDLIPATMETFNKVAGLFPNASELIYTPAGSRQLLNGQPFAGWSPAVQAQHYDHIHLAMHQGGVVPALANGGPVQPGRPYIVGDGGQPELFVPDSSGYVFPEVPMFTGQSAADISATLDDVDIEVGPRGDRTIVRVVTLDGRVLGEAVFDDAADEEARL
ncbi:phage tail tape measure protein [Microbacterium karelineae]|uniref:phage tail tape measure protein n=1 Tax=Microbacterium karelineae TaxID=2654283 RepID=UPI0012EA73C4|nr:phage tail tape measure protein [Microbacterium karelineae]